MVGIFLVGAAYVMLLGTSLMMDEDHITDKGIAIRDKNNATYTWTHHEFDEQSQAGFCAVFAGGASLAVAFALAFASPSKKQLHKLGCKGSDEWKYCPECGIKMSELEKKGR